MMSELKPCPFCGAPGVLRHNPWKVYCANDECGAETSFAFFQASAITAWNTRTPDPRVTQLVEALDWFCVQSEVWLDGRVENAKPGWMKVAIARARQALGE